MWFLLLSIHSSKVILAHIYLIRHQIEAIDRIGAISVGIEQNKLYKSSRGMKIDQKIRDREGVTSVWKVDTIAKHIERFFQISTL